MTTPDLPPLPSSRFSRNSGTFAPLYDANQMRTYGDARAAAAVLAERERCAKLCESEHVGESVNDDRLVSGDMAYNTALRHAAAAIRAEPKGAAP